MTEAGLTAAGFLTAGAFDCFLAGAAFLAGVADFLSLGADADFFASGLAALALPLAGAAGFFLSVDLLLLSFLADLVSLAGDFEGLAFFPSNF
jgi:hypothetical protein